jgi:FKBP-type peptidyl-prolyl cis-trans isomerase FkpA/FKBP-type peptidyl-prolyl cis-trans isomerase FklB
MRIRHSAAFLGAALLLSACGGTGSSNAALDTDDQKASYGIGLDMGRSLAPAQGRLDMAAFSKGIEDAMAGAEPALTQEVIQAALQAFSQSIMEAQQAEQAAAGEKNKAEGEAYLAENGARDGVTTTESGLQYEVLTQGDGPMPTAEDRVRVHYRGTLVDGTEFDSSLGGEPAEFGVGGVISGFGEALQLMPVGSKYRFVIPSDLAYGPGGSGGGIGPNATLVFELELLGILE